MSILARIDQQINLVPGFTDAKGNVVTELGSVPAWSVSDANIATLEVGADGFSATVKPTGALGTVQVNMVVDADPDADVEEINGVVEIEFKAGKANFVTLSGTVADLEAAAPTEPTEPETPVEPETPTEPTEPEAPVEPAPVDPEAPVEIDPNAPQA